MGALQSLRSASADNPAFTLALSTHPATQVRLDQLEQAMGNRLDSYSGAPAITVAQRLQKLADASRPAPVAAPAPTPSPRPASRNNTKK